jgi:hypothetical protein
MWLWDKHSQRLVDRAQPYVDAPLIAVAAFGWPVTWDSPRHPVHRPELAGGLPRTVLLALSQRRLHLLETEPSRFTPDRSRRVAGLLGSWERAAAPVRVERTTGEAPLVTLALPGRPVAQLHALHGATREFLDLLRHGAPAWDGEAPLGRRGASSAP